MDENKNIENTNNENIDNGNNAAGNRIDEKKTAGNSKLSYIIIGICCVAALVVGLFAGKTIADKRKVAMAQAFIAEVESLVEEGCDYWYGINGKTKDDNMAREQFEAALELNEENGRALYYLGDIEIYKENYSVAKEDYEKAISAGEPLAALALGYLYQNGNGVGKDYKKAMELYEQAIADGCVEANVGIGDFYQSGYDGYEADGFKAIEYFEKATDGEEPEWVAYAYSSIATIYRYAQGGVEKDTDKALE